ncbi:MAG: glycosyltransferase [Nitrospiraceae bacterium]|nr:glycosyltransferase [Nitrospiraceae bacterium]
MKILQAISGIWEHTGGPAESVPKLCSALARYGNNVSILTLDGLLSSATEECRADGVEICTVSHHRQVSFAVFKASLVLSKQVDLVHGHGLWLPTNWAAGRAARRNNKPLVISLRGSLNPKALNHSRWKKLVAGFLFDNKYLRAARCLHATSTEEYKAIRSYGLKNPVAIIPNGVETKFFVNLSVENEFFKRHYVSEDKKILLYLSRISWEKGLEDLAVAWGKVAGDFTDWELVIVGQGRPDYVSKVKGIFQKGPGWDRVKWLGLLTGADKFAAYAAASLFVLPSHTENFSLVTAEALAAGLPVITTHGTPWSELPEKGCGWWIPIGAESLTKTLCAALALPENILKEMGVRGKALIGSKYSWSVIAEEMINVYEWVMGNREIPSCVRLD